MSLLAWRDEPPQLRRPLLIVALEGFIDAGAAAGTAAMFLRHRWQAEIAGTFDRDALIDYRARRPTAIVDGGRLRRVEWPSVELYAARPGGLHDALLLLGAEPDMQWEAFFEEVAGACRLLGVECVVGLGAYPAAVPHTRPTRLVKAHNGVGAAVVPEVLEVGGYTGPVGAGTVLHGVLADHGIPAVGVWAEVPHYIAGSPNPNAALALVQLVTGQMQVEIDTDELEAAAKLHNEQVDAAVREHPEAGEMVKLLENHVDEGRIEQRLPTGDDIAAEIERFLRSESD